MNVLVRQTAVRSRALTHTVRRRMGGDDLTPEDAVRTCPCARGCKLGVSVPVCPGALSPSQCPLLPPVRMAMALTPLGDVKLWRALTFGSVFFCIGLYKVITVRPRS